MAVEVGPFGDRLAETGKHGSMVTARHFILAGVYLPGHAAFPLPFKGEDAICPAWYPCPAVLVPLWVQFVGRGEADASLFEPPKEVLLQSALVGELLPFQIRTVVDLILCVFILASVEA